jgi:hypothetical protein
MSSGESVTSNVRRSDTSSSLFAGVAIPPCAASLGACPNVHQATISPAALTVPDGVEASICYGKDRAVHILVNFSDKEQAVHPPSTMKDEMNDGRSLRELLLPISGVAIPSEAR